MNILFNFLNQQITEADESLTKILSINNYDEEQQIYENEAMEEIFQDEIKEIFRSEQLEEKYR